MRRIYLFLFIFSLCACEKDDSTPYTYSTESTIYAPSEQTALREIVFMLKPYIRHRDEKKYIVSPYITNIHVLVNGRTWGNFESLKTDTASIGKERLGNFHVCTNPIKNIVTASYRISDETITTAGQYSDLLNGYLSLRAGEYICQIDYFELTDISRTVHRIYPLIAERFEVKENSVSVFVGEFDILIE